MFLFLELVQDFVLFLQLVVNVIYSDFGLVEGELFLLVRINDCVEVRNNQKHGDGHHAGVDVEVSRFEWILSCDIASVSVGN